MKISNKNYCQTFENFQSVNVSQQQRSFLLLPYNSLPIPNILVFLANFVMFLVVVYFLICLAVRCFSWQGLPPTISNFFNLLQSLSSSFHCQFQRILPFLTLPTSTFLPISDTNHTFFHSHLTVFKHVPEVFKYCPGFAFK